MGSSSSVMVSMLDWQTITSEYESHWVSPYIQPCVTTKQSLVNK